eukprot:PLAT11679.3.p1 GENE.PLAT11679.3~~PLAT11679.3.p1  ORF type:complete len:1095 (-),score=366.95 PLAT11679.3:2090-5131(-)
MAGSLQVVTSGSADELDVETQTKSLALVSTLLDSATRVAGSSSSAANSTASNGGSSSTATAPAVSEELATPLVAALGNVLAAQSAQSGSSGASGSSAGNNSTAESDAVNDAVLDTVSRLSSSMLSGARAGDPPVIVETEHLTMFSARLGEEGSDDQSVGEGLSLKIPSTNSSGMDVVVMNWSPSGAAAEDIQSKAVSISLRDADGGALDVSSLSEPIQLSIPVEGDTPATEVGCGYWDAEQGTWVTDGQIVACVTECNGKRSILCSAVQLPRTRVADDDGDGNGDGEDGNAGSSGGGGGGSDGFVDFGAVLSNNAPKLNVPDPVTGASALREYQLNDFTTPYVLGCVLLLAVAAILWGRLVDKREKRLVDEFRRQQYMQTGTFGTKPHFRSLWERVQYQMMADHMWWSFVRPPLNVRTLLSRPQRVSVLLSSVMVTFCANGLLYGNDPERVGQVIATAALSLLITLPANFILPRLFKWVNRMDSTLSGMWTATHNTTMTLDVALNRRGPSLESVAARRWLRSNWFAYVRVLLRVFAVASLLQAMALLFLGASSMTSEFVLAHRLVRLQLLAGVGLLMFALVALWLGRRNWPIVSLVALIANVLLLLAQGVLLVAWMTDKLGLLHMKDSVYEDDWRALTVTAAGNSEVREALLKLQRKHRCCGWSTWTDDAVGTDCTFEQRGCAPFVRREVRDHFQLPMLTIAVCSLVEMCVVAGLVISIRLGMYRAFYRTAPSEMGVMTSEEPAEATFSGLTYPTPDSSGRLSSVDGVEMGSREHVAAAAASVRGPAVRPMMRHGSSGSSGSGGERSSVVSGPPVRTASRRLIRVAPAEERDSKISTKDALERLVPTVERAPLRRMLRREDKAARVIQRHFRGFVARKAFFRERELLIWAEMVRLRRLMTTLIYAMVVLLVAIAMYLNLVFGIRFDNQQAQAWMASAVLSLMVDIVALQPAQILVKATLLYSVGKMKSKKKVKPTGSAKSSPRGSAHSFTSWRSGGASVLPEVVEEEERKVEE